LLSQSCKEREKDPRKKKTALGNFCERTAVVSFLCTFFYYCTMSVKKKEKRKNFGFRRYRSKNLSTESESALMFSLAYK
jgi:hypothetical protein